MLERMGRKGNPPTPLVGTQVGAATMENSTQKTKENYHMIQQSHSWAYVWTKLLIQKDTVPLCS